ncbi:MAG: UDP-3-O-(3-hydroxymyristoyl)glucosamine N-acyltransferase [Chitinophagaceae bacterium]|nr:UDP-3-O-(3-hydroxymyristoyl)glucosamine N-acyltransferase [Chitinophagaceae bacterium]
MIFSAAQIASLINGSVEGDPNANVHSFNKIEVAGEGQLAFLANPKYEDYLYTTRASIVIINQSQQLKEKTNSTLIRVPDAYSAFAALLAKYQEIMEQQLTGLQENAYVAATATIGNDVFIGSYAYVSEHAEIGNRAKLYPHSFVGEKVSIGEGAIIHPSVTIYHGCKIGRNVIIHAGAVIGSDGFGFAPQQDGTYSKIPQIGNVIIEDNVEIGANSTIDRATIGSTIIRKGAKIDNLVHLAHNVEIGQHTAIAAQSGVSGSTKIGNHVMIGGQAGIVGHITIADGARINAQSGVSKSIKQPKAAVTGSPAYDYTSALRSQAISRKLPDLEKRIQELEFLVKQLSAEKV